MIKINITGKDRKICEYERKHHIHPRVRQKTDVLRLKIRKMSHEKTAEIAGISENTVTTYLRRYKEGGPEKSRETKSDRPVGGLTQHISTSEAYFTEHPPASAKEATGRIGELTGLKRSGTQVREFLISSGLKRRRVGMIPAEADIGKQEIFKKQEPEPRLKEAAQGKRKVFFYRCRSFCPCSFSGLSAVADPDIYQSSGRKKKVQCIGRT